VLVDLLQGNASVLEVETAATQGILSVLLEQLPGQFEIELLGVTPPPFGNVGNGELKDLLAKGTKIVDVRRPEEWKQTGVVKGSKLLMSFDKKGKLNPDFLDGLAAYVKKDEPVILICRTGSRTGYLSNALATQLGYSKIYNVTDGITKWIADKNPVAKL